MATKVKIIEPISWGALAREHYGDSLQDAIKSILAQYAIKLNEVIEAVNEQARRRPTK